MNEADNNWGDPGNTSWIDLREEDWLYWTISTSEWENTIKKNNLVEKAANWDSQAINDLSDLLRKIFRVFYWNSTLVKINGVSHLEDLIQDSIIWVLDNLHIFSQDSSVIWWMNTMLRRKAFDLQRHDKVTVKKEAQIAKALYIPSVENPWTIVWHREIIELTRQWIMQALEKLNDEEKELIQFLYFQGRDNEHWLLSKYAKRLGIDRFTVTNNKNKVLSILKKELMEKLGKEVISELLGKN